MVNILEENLHCHHLLFNHDVITSKYNATEDSFEVTETGLVYRNARLSGVVVSQKQVGNEHHVWLDDSTAVIRMILPPSILKRKAYKSMRISLSVTAIGKIKRLNNTDENAIYCSGLQIHKGIEEIYYLLKVIQERPKKITTPQKQYMFQSLSSQPSPQRLTYFQSPIRECHPKDFIFSPTHAVTTSTPLRISLMKHTEDNEEEEEEDEFGFSDLGDMEFAILEDEEKEAKKRKIDC